MIKVLFIEDDADQIFLFKKRFDLDKIEAMAARTSQEAFAILKHTKPDVILLDVLLGRENGLDILDMLKAEPAAKDIPVIIFTNYEKNALKRESTIDKSSEFLMKLKVTPDQLVKKVLSLVEKAN